MTSALPVNIAMMSALQGFDGCQEQPFPNPPRQPTVTEMQRFWPGSPYYTFFVYLGRSGWAYCGPGGVDSSWVDQVTNVGWSLVPIWVGLQAPCRPGGGISYDLATATQQGANEAAAASTTAQNFGFSPDRGIPIIYDMEFFQGDDACRAAVHAFIDGWVAQLHIASFSAAVYENGCCYPIDLITLHVPDAMWFADWGPPLNNSVWNIAGVPNGYWIFDQRYHQYRGGHYETAGNPGAQQTLWIDSTCSNFFVGGSSATTDTSWSDSDPPGTDEGQGPTEDPSC